MALQMALCVSPHGPLAARSSTRRSLSNRGTGWDAREGPVLRGTSQRGHVLASGASRFLTLILWVKGTHQYSNINVSRANPCLEPNLQKTISHEIGT